MSDSESEFDCEQFLESEKLKEGRVIGIRDDNKHKRLAKLKEGNYKKKEKPIGDPWPHLKWQDRFDSCVGKEEHNLRKNQSNEVHVMRAKMCRLADTYNCSGILLLSFPNGAQHSKYTTAVGNALGSMEEGGEGYVIKKLFNRLADNIQAERIDCLDEANYDYKGKKFSRPPMKTFKSEKSSHSKKLSLSKTIDYDDKYSDEYYDSDTDSLGSGVESQMPVGWGIIPCPWNSSTPPPIKLRVPIYSRGPERRTYKSAKGLVESIADDFCVDDSVPSTSTVPFSKLDNGKLDVVENCEEFDRSSVTERSTRENFSRNVCRRGSGFAIRGGMRRGRGGAQLPKVEPKSRVPFNTRTTSKRKADSKMTTRNQAQNKKVAAASHIYTSTDSSSEETNLPPLHSGKANHDSTIHQNEATASKSKGKKGQAAESQKSTQPIPNPSPRQTRSKKKN